MLLQDFVPRYADTSLDRLSDAYVTQLYTAVRVFEITLGREVRVEELSDQLVNQFTDALYSTRAADTVRTRRASILALWREAFRQELTDKPPMRIRRLKRHRRIVRAWTYEEVRRLMWAANSPTILLNGIPSGLFYRSIISVGWDTALRLGDLLTLRYDQIGGRNQIIVDQHKTGDQIICHLSNTSRRLIEESYRSQPHRQLLWPLWAGRDAFYRRMRILVKKAGVSPGTFRYIRRGSITAVEKAGGDGSLHAGHSSRWVTEHHYLDKSQLRGSVVRPPEL